MSEEAAPILPRERNTDDSLDTIDDPRIQFMADDVSKVLDVNFNTPDTTVMEPEETYTEKVQAIFRVLQVDLAKCESYQDYMVCIETLSLHVVGLKDKIKKDIKYWKAFYSSSKEHAKKLRDELVELMFKYIRYDPTDERGRAAIFERVQFKLLEIVQYLITLSSVAKEAGGSAKEQFGKLVAFCKRQLEHCWDFIRNTFPAFERVVRHIALWLGPAIKRAMEGLKAAFIWIWDGCCKILTAIVDGLISVLNCIFRPLLNLLAWLFCKADPISVPH